MTLKNTDKFRMVVTNHQTMDSETDIITETGTGSLREAGGVWYVKYKADSVSVMIKVSGDIVHVKRSGEFGTDIDYIKNKKTQFPYKTPYGVMDMEVYTKNIRSALSMLGGVITLDYDLIAGSGVIGNKMEIKIAAI